MNRTIINFVAVVGMAAISVGLFAQEQQPAKNRGAKKPANELGPSDDTGARLSLDDRKAAQISFLGVGTDVPDVPKTDVPKTDVPGEKNKDNDGSVSATDSNGKRSIKVSNTPNLGIVVEVVRKYEADELDRLAQRHPELSDYIELFPTQIGDSEIEMSLSLKTVYRASTLEELKQQHPEGFNLYRRYYKPKQARTSK